MATAPEGIDKRSAAERLADIFTSQQRGFVINLSKELARGNVSFPQYFLLGFLAIESPMTMSAIAKRMRHTTAAATGLVDRLERLGFARRQADTNDRRKVFVNITKRGMDLVNRIREDMVSNILRLMELLTPEQQATWLTINETIIPHCKTE
jgi:DNA-binding MarR family transcriptional regulator